MRRRRTLGASSAAHRAASVTPRILQHGGHERCGIFVPCDISLGMEEVACGGIGRYRKCSWAPAPCAGVFACLHCGVMRVRAQRPRFWFRVVNVFAALFRLAVFARRGVRCAQYKHYACIASNCGASALAAAEACSLATLSRAQTSLHFRAAHARRYRRTRHRTSPLHSGIARRHRAAAHAIKQLRRERAAAHSRTSDGMAAVRDGAVAWFL